MKFMELPIPTDISLFIALNSKKFTDLGPVDDKIVFHGPERYWRSLPRALICDISGKVFFSGTDGMIRYYDPATGKLVSTRFENSRGLLLPAIF